MSTLHSTTPKKLLGITKRKSAALTQGGRSPNKTKLLRIAVQLKCSKRELKFPEPLVSVISIVLQRTDWQDRSKLDDDSKSVANVQLQPLLLQLVSHCATDLPSTWPEVQNRRDLTPGYFDVHSESRGVLLNCQEELLQPVDVRLSLARLRPRPPCRHVPRPTAGLEHFCPCCGRLLRSCLLKRKPLDSGCEMFEPGPRGCTPLGVLRGLLRRQHISYLTPATPIALISSRGSGPGFRAFQKASDHLGILAWCQAASPSGSSGSQSML